MSDQFLEIDDTDDEEATESDASHVALEDLLEDEDGDSRRSRTSDGETEEFDAQTVDYTDGEDADKKEAGESAAGEEEDVEDVAPAVELDDPDESDVVLSDVLPKQKDEFVCSSCFLVQHKSRRAGSSTRCHDCD